MARRDGCVMVDRRAGVQRHVPVVFESESIDADGEKPVDADVLQRTRFVLENVVEQLQKGQTLTGVYPSPWPIPAEMWAMPGTPSARRASDAVYSLEHHSGMRTCPLRTTYSA